MLSEQKITHAMPAHSVELSVDESAPVTRATPVDVISSATVIRKEGDFLVMTELISTTNIGYAKSNGRSILASMIVRA